VLSRLKLETFLRQAIERREFVMLHQPIVDVVAGRWAGFEALARWDRPELGLISPDVFIPLAEESGLIIPLGELIMDLAIRDAVMMFGQLAEGGELYVAVNVSVIQLHDPTLPATVAAALARHGLPASQLVVEVTESAVMASPDQARDVLRELTALGVRVLIDDFGTGHSSIARLGDLPGAGVKIDRRFSRGLGSDPRAEKILSAIASLAHAHEHPVVAEGIESADALAAVARLGCEYAQGFHLALPARGAEVVKVLALAPPG
jgi:EAL domain-containing protein (putative c-di-GMP-specific phosphodiesterase class I)